MFVLHNYRYKLRHTLNVILLFYVIGPEEICSFIIGDACGDVYNPYHDWEVMFPPVAKPTPQVMELPKVFIYICQLFLSSK